MRRLTIGLLAFASLAFAAGTAVAASNLELSATLHASSGYPATRGSSDYSIDHNGREVDIHLSGIQPLGGRQVTICVAGRRLGTVTVSRQGSVHREWRTSSSSRTAGGGCDSAPIGVVSQAGVASVISAERTSSAARRRAREERRK